MLNFLDYVVIQVVLDVRLGPNHQRHRT